ncbi:hypothetical protein jhhlp_008420 [Lomentospora prolificans]|uniref:BTB domain-containing protein n=1 Tax=Lomentospora prolificans TaxID=41688 RepID=A0A2N3MY01_9PEZI|nr:hypothetical protein jhhlp_008420 [Lomentospora prolificans]
MSHLLWKYYWDNDADRFRRLLAPSGFNAQSTAKASTVNFGSSGGSPGGHATSPRPGSKPRKSSGYALGAQGSKIGALSGLGTIGKSEINSRDYAGLTLLLRAASSTAPNAICFVEALLDHPAIDIYVRDYESGWNALHRALYAGNVSIARLLLQAEQRILTETPSNAANGRVGQLIKTKDREGNSPFDLYNSTIATRDTNQSPLEDLSDTESSASGTGDPNLLVPRTFLSTRRMINLYAYSDEISCGFSHGAHGFPGDELYTFGSNKNLSLGVGDESDRQFPEKLTLSRPEELIEHFYRDYLSKKDKSTTDQQEDESFGSIPALVRERPVHIRDVALSKFHSAVLTTDSVSNLYVCGVGRGGRLGVGDENTRFRFVPVLGPLAGKRVTHIALGQNHSLAVVDHGELWSWGSNSLSQLGYTLPTPSKADEEPVSLTPRQVFGPLKKETIVGVAASPVHSVAHTSMSLYCWGRNLGQLGLMDADSRSLEVQATPRKVAASLISTPILMVSAIEKATTVLLASNNVFVFTSYGYNLVKFPAPDIFANTRFGTAAPFTHRNLNKIKAITSGGETIAALSARGDLFLMNLNHQVDTNMSATSTTNPTKIKKGAVSRAQCIWSARKDGVTSVSIGEHGSVIICTESGAVWRRVKRAKAKDAAMPGTTDIKRKDFKFQRVPGITNSVAVRSSTFGAFATVRRDCISVTERIKVDEQTLWEDIASLFPLAEFEPSHSRTKVDLKIWDNEKKLNRISQIAYDVLRSPDIENDLEVHLRILAMSNLGYDTVVCTSSAPGLAIPVHGWVLAARSSVLCKILQEFSDEGEAEIPDVLSIRRDKDFKRRIIFHGLDILSLLNLVVYAYKDEVIPVWNYLRQVPHLAFRYRQARVELMKLATRLNMAKLEAAARTQSRIVKSLDRDFALAVRDMDFLESGDVIIGLNGAEVPVHSQLMCQRCPFFCGLFQGRSQGQWLAGRLEESMAEGTKIQVDLSHMEPHAFRYVLTYLYGDVGLELFDDTVSTNIDEFSELVMEVMSIANELMLKRLSQICQQVISRFVNTRNLSLLLNEISPCSVKEFKDAGLEYACLHMEAMLENHLLDELEDDLMEELDESVRKNQLARAPISRSGRAELSLHERYPELVEDIEEERRRRTKEMAWKATHREDEKKLSLSYRTKYGSFDDGLSASPSLDKSRRKGKAQAYEPKSPNLRPDASQSDMIFSMDEDDTNLVCPESPSLRQANRRALQATSQAQTPVAAAKDKEKVSFRPVPQSQRRQPTEASSPVGTPHQLPSTLGKEKLPLVDIKAESPWGATPLSTSKLDLRSIMSESSGSKPSGIAAGLAAQKGKEVAQKPTPTKLSQKERKKQQQLEASQRVAAELAAQEQPKKAWDTQTSEKAATPWKVAGIGIPKTSLKDVMSTASSKQSAVKALTTAASVVPTMGTSSMKPLVATEAAGRSVPRRTASPDTRFSGQARAAGSSHAYGGSGPSSSRAALKQPVAPYSKSYIKPAPKAEPSLRFSLEDIIGQQQREQELVKEAVAKRPLADIQQEQAFQEWWDQESRRMQEEEARRIARENEKEREKGGKRGGKRGRGGKPRGAGGAGGGGGSDGPPGNKQGGAEAGSNSGRPLRNGKANGNRGARGRVDGRVVVS